MNATMMVRGLWIFLKEIWIGVSIHFWFERVQSDPNPMSRILLVGIPVAITVLCLLVKARMRKQKKHASFHPSGSKGRAEIKPRIRSMRLAIRLDWQNGEKHAFLNSFFESASHNGENRASEEESISRDPKMTKPLADKSFQP